MTNKTNAARTTLRLTALWGLCESGLGGMMHLLKLPFTGLLVGGMAMIIISIMATYSKTPFKTIAQATVLVLLVKFTVSPQSPMPAYVAVAFQGLMGALLFQFLPYRAATIALLMLGMAESALQGILLATIIYGKELWTAVDLSFAKLTESLHLHISGSFSAYFIAAYALLYVMGGLLIGLWTIRLPAQMLSRKDALLAFVSKSAVETDTPQSRKKKLPTFIFPIIVLAFICVILWQTGNSQQITQVVLRTIGVIILLIFVVQPLVFFALRSLKRDSGWNSRLQDVMSEIGGSRQYSRQAYAYTAPYKGLRRYKEFILALLVLTIYSDISGE